MDAVHCICAARLLVGVLQKAQIVGLICFLLLHLFQVVLDYDIQNLIVKHFGGLTVDKRQRLEASSLAEELSPSPLGKCTQPPRWS
jgi:hypothetical protein